MSNDPRSPYYTFNWYLEAEWAAADEAQAA